jgi:hypothetical protein
VLFIDDLLDFEYSPVTIFKYQKTFPLVGTIMKAVGKAYVFVRVKKGKGLLKDKRKSYKNCNPCGPIFFHPLKDNAEHFVPVLRKVLNRSCRKSSRMRTFPSLATRIYSRNTHIRIEIRQQRESMKITVKDIAYGFSQK